MPGARARSQDLTETLVSDWVNVNESGYCAPMDATVPGGEGRPPSMHDVARLAGVSHQTVSRVLNDSPSVRTETRERVEAAIAELGYRRNLAARALVTGRSHAIGVLGPYDADYGPMRTIQAVEVAAREAGFLPLMTTATRDREGLQAGIDFLLARAVDAIVVVAQHPIIGKVVDEMAPDLPVAYVLTGKGGRNRSIAIDQEAGVRLAVEHLVGLGHTRIQHVRGPDEYAEADLRAQAYDEIMREHGLEPMPLLQGDWSAESGYALEIDPGATGVFVANDQMALGIVKRLCEQGRDVPGDVSVVGFDDLEESAFFRPGLTTVRQDFSAVGQSAVKFLAGQLSGVRPAPPTPLEPTLLVRASTAPLT